MQKESVSRREAVTFPENKNNTFAQRNRSLYAHNSPNAKAVPQLTLQDKAGLVFVVMVLLMLQILEKLKVIK